MSVTRLEELGKRAKSLRSRVSNKMKELGVFTDNIGPTQGADKNQEAD